MVEKISGASTKRPQYEKVLEMLRRDDERVVWDIDRLGKATRELIMLIARLNGMGIRFRSLTPPHIDLIDRAKKCFLGDKPLKNKVLRHPKSILGRIV